MVWTRVPARRNSGVSLEEPDIYYFTGFVRFDPDVTTLLIEPERCIIRATRASWIRADTPNAVSHSIRER